MAKQEKLSFEGLYLRKNIAQIIFKLGVLSNHLRKKKNYFKLKFKNKR